MDDDLEGMDEIYCPHCGGCGYIGCDGIRAFLNTHVKDKTNCVNEDSFIQDIIEYVEMKEEDATNGE